MYDIVRTNTRRWRIQWGGLPAPQVPLLSCPEPHRPFSLLTHRSSVFHAQVVYAFFLTQGSCTLSQLILYPHRHLPLGTQSQIIVVPPTLRPNLRVQ